jgi:hypothetical protein
MDTEWQYTCAGVHLVRGIKQYATKGYIAIDASGDLILYNNKTFHVANLSNRGRFILSIHALGSRVIEIGLDLESV